MYTFFVNASFDLHEASPGDYSKAHAALEEIGLERTVPANDGGRFPLTNTTAVGNARGYTEAQASAITGRLPNGKPISREYVLIDLLP